MYQYVCNRHKQKCVCVSVSSTNNHNHNHNHTHSILTSRHVLLQQLYLQVEDLLLEVTQSVFHFLPPCHHVTQVTHLEHREWTFVNNRLHRDIFVTADKSTCDGALCGVGDDEKSLIIRAKTANVRGVCFKKKKKNLWLKELAQQSDVYVKF